MRLACCLVAALVLGGPARAGAHGAVPGASQLLHDGDRLLVATRGTGLFVGRAGGEWRWVCDEAINRRADRVFARTLDGTLLVTDYLGVQSSRDGGCSWTRAGGDLALREPSALVADPLRPGRAWATTRSTGVPWNALFVTDDGGASWSVAWQGAEYLHGLALSGDAQTIYLVGTALPGAPWPRLHASRDGGGSWSSVELDGTVLPRAAAEVIPRAVDPGDPTVLWLVADLGQVDALWRMDRADGSAPRVTELVSGDAILGNLAFDRRRPEAPVLYLATMAGLRRQVGVGPLLRVGPLVSVSGVDVEAGAVWALASTFPPDHAALARSDDGGDTFTPVMCFGDAVGPIAGCPPGSAADTLCPIAWPEAAAQLGAGCAPPPDGGASDGSGDQAMADATATVRAASGGCACAVTSTSAPAARPTVAAALALALLLTARRATARSGRRWRRRPPPAPAPSRARSR